MQKRRDVDLDPSQKAWIIGVVAAMSIGGGTLSMWAFSAPTGYERPAFLFAMALYGMICLMGGIAWSVVLPDNTETNG